MKINLSKLDEQFVRDKLATGEYASVDEVVAEALNVLRNVERQMTSSKDDLRREIDIGLQDIARGRTSDWNPQELKRELSRKARKAS
jgi:antitoxin ParD1/3/4